jgi:Arc/MetJ family transcription regulator
MRTTIRLDDRLMAAAKRRAAETGRTFTAVVEDALRQCLAPTRPTGRRRPVKLRTVGGRGVRPGVDLDDSAALLDLMESSR